MARFIYYLVFSLLLLFAPIPSFASRACYLVLVICIKVLIFRKNGFVLEEDVDAPPGQRFMLKAVPFSKNITFGVAGNSPVF